ncbi:MAG: nickel pincer cofactor biosynthesis protein LarC [Gemmatimonadetes bacterium]|nr:nickel pincer cofactor biosynthesis protein LarC [Gemmatimonadota bacterium]NIO30858.1 nickel pincer cofactor biosynthesis protein LarC [Gemmatimonadota bacterium]
MEERSRCLIFDPFAGISGDMILGGLIDLGLEADWLKALVSDLPVKVDLSIEEVSRGSIKATAVRVETLESGVVRHLKDVLEIIDAANVDEKAREWAAAAFRKLADVEGGVHGIAPEKVHFHEVGADDAIVDILGACAGMSQLGIDRCFTRPVAVGIGWVVAQHGALPLPAPATIRLLEDLPVRESELEGELTTPTGAVLLSVLTGGQRLHGDFTPVRSGYGAGVRDPSTHPNCLRLIIADLDARGDLIVMQADIDDMSPEYAPSLLEELFAAGAIDAWTQPVQMKKGRTGLRIEVLVPETGREAVSRALFQGSTTLGLRYWRVQREILPRAAKTVEWRGHTIRVKASTSPDGHVHYKPEFDDVAAAARAEGVPTLRAQDEIEQLLRDA